MVKHIYEVVSNILGNTLLYDNIFKHIYISVYVRYILLQQSRISKDEHDRQYTTTVEQKNYQLRGDNQELSMEACFRIRKTCLFEHFITL